MAMELYSNRSQRGSDNSSNLRTALCKPQNQKPFYMNVYNCIYTFFTSLWSNKKNEDCTDNQNWSSDEFNERKAFYTQKCCPRDYLVQFCDENTIYESLCCDNELIIRTLSEEVKPFIEIKDLKELLNPNSYKCDNNGVNNLELVRTCIIAESDSTLSLKEFHESLLNDQDKVIAGLSKWIMENNKVTSGEINLLLEKKVYGVNDSNDSNGCNEEINLQKHNDENPIKNKKYCKAVLCRPTTCNSSGDLNSCVTVDVCENKALYEARNKDVSNCEYNGISYGELCGMIEIQNRLLSENELRHNEANRDLLLEMRSLNSRIKRDSYFKY